MQMPHKLKNGEPCGLNISRAHRFFEVVIKTTAERTNSWLHRYSAPSISSPSWALLH